ncbi:hypothetical protein [Streptomyces albogriseolus]|uniref:hypothetical protein n=1 Tax=Streptomyces albogriseolus TaxID=1887 RepID=UPI003814A09A
MRRFAERNQALATGGGTIVTPTTRAQVDAATRCSAIRRRQRRTTVYGSRRCGKRPTPSHNPCVDRGRLETDDEISLDSAVDLLERLSALAGSRVEEQLGLYCWYFVP